MNGSRVPTRDGVTMALQLVSIGTKLKGPVGFGIPRMLCPKAEHNVVINLLT